MSTQEEVAAALQVAYFYLKFRPRTEREMRLYLQKKREKRGWAEEIIDQTITLLKEQELINDHKFITWLVDSRNRTKPKSSFALRSELIKLGISKDLLTEYFSSYEADETALAIQAVQSRWRRFQLLPSQERFQKAAAFLSRRGFSFEVIRKAIKTLEEDIPSA